MHIGKRKKKERHLRRQRNHQRSRQKGRRSQQWARMSVNNRATRGVGEVEEQKCSNAAANSQEGPKGNLSLRVTLPTSWSMHCAGRAPGRGCPQGHQAPLWPWVLWERVEQQGSDRDQQGSSGKGCMWKEQGVYMGRGTIPGACG